MKQYTEEEWMAEGKRRFGENILYWKFVCPACKRVNCVQEFLEFDVDVNRAYIECIGRYNGKGVSGLYITETDTNENGCDWAAYGLFRTFGKGVIVKKKAKKEVDGMEIELEKEMYVFDFANEEK